MMTIDTRRGMRTMCPLLLPCIMAVASCATSVTVERTPPDRPEQPSPPSPPLHQPAAADNPAFGVVVADGVEVDMSNIRRIAFRETPNLYFISFEAMAPRALLEKHLGINDTLFHEVFDAEFRRFPNFFVNAVGTFHSLNMLMALDEDVYAGVGSAMSPRNASFFSGSLPSPLLRILRDNGYETSSLYLADYFGSSRGTHIDNYFIEPVRSGKRDSLDFSIEMSTVRDGESCTVTREVPDDDEIEIIRTGQYIPGPGGGRIWEVDIYPALYGLPAAIAAVPPWNPADTADRSKSWDVYFDEERSTLTYVRRQCGPADVDLPFFLRVETMVGSEVGFLMDKLIDLGADKPQFMIAHLHPPGHVASHFRYDDQDHFVQFRDKYIRESHVAGWYLKTIVEHLERNEPDAMLFVYGDHGPALSQGVPFDENPEFVVQDRFGVVGGVYPRDRCAGYFDAALQQGYMTVLDAVHAILGCLSGGQSALIRPRENELGGFGGVPRDSGYDYGDFRYE